MTKALVLAGVALLCACGSDDGETKDPGRDWTPPLEPPPAGEQFECDRRRAGTYLVSLTTIDGSCGDQDSYIGRLDNDQPLPDGCTLLALDVWSDDDCTLERSFICETDAVSAGGMIETRAVTTQQSANKINGIMTMLIWAGDGSVICSGTYNLEATRQTASSPPEPTECSGPDQGIYFVTTEWVDGSSSCEPATGLVSIDPDALGKGCENLSEPDISEDRCETKLHQICPFDDLGPEATAESITVLRNDSGDGAVVAGTTTVTIDSGTSTWCSGTFRVRYELQ